MRETDTDPAAGAHTETIDALSHRTSEPGERVADAMLARPKTLPASASVADLRRLFANPKVMTALLVDGAALAGVVDRDGLPATAADHELPVTTPAPRSCGRHPTWPSARRAPGLTTTTSDDSSSSRRTARCAGSSASTGVAPRSAATNRSRPCGDDPTRSDGRRRLDFRPRPALASATGPR